MRAVPPNVSIRELLKEAFSKMTTAASYGGQQEVEPFDSAFMNLLTQSDQPNPFLLVVGENYLDEIQQHAYYYSAKLGKRCWYLCLESTPMTCVLSTLSLSSGIPIEVLQSSRIPPPYFPAFNEGAAELYAADLTFCPLLSADIGTIVSLAKYLKRNKGVEVLLIDALHRVEFEPGKISSPTEQRWISQVLRAVAHAGELTVVAGFHLPGVPFPDLAADSVYHCESTKRKEVVSQGRISQVAASIIAKFASGWKRLVH